MKAFASIFLIAATFGAPALAQEQAAPRSKPVLSVQIAQLGQRCVTSGGSCPVAPKPVGSQCFCGNVPGQVR